MSYCNLYEKGIDRQKAETKPEVKSEVKSEVKPDTAKVQHVFLIGAKSFGAYGGYETFINKLTEYHQKDDRIQYHVVCKANGQGCLNPDAMPGMQWLTDTEFSYHGAHCFAIRVPEKIGSAQAIWYDLAALKKCIAYVQEKKISHPIVYIMACRIGPFMRRYADRLHKLGGRIYLNPDGHEWKRSKWPLPVRKYWKRSEQQMVRCSDLVICDSVNIEKYIHQTYDGKGIGGRDPSTVFIAYGAETRRSRLSNTDKGFLDWMERQGVTPGGYYLIVGRFVPENNYETMLREFMRSRTDKALVIVTNRDDRFAQILEKKLHWQAEPRVRFAGTVYDLELLMKIRENAYGYFHGHEVGGTNPSLLEALGSTSLNLLLDVGFNREVAEDAALYWSKEEGSLAALIEKADAMEPASVEALGLAAVRRIRDAYSWQLICDRYADVFLHPPV